MASLVTLPPEGTALPGQPQDRMGPCGGYSAACDFARQQRDAVTPLGTGDSLDRRSRSRADVESGASGLSRETHALAQGPRLCGSPGACGPHQAHTASCALRRRVRGFAVSARGSRQLRLNCECRAVHRELDTALPPFRVRLGENSIKICRRKKEGKKLFCVPLINCDETSREDVTAEVCRSMARRSGQRSWELPG